MADKTCFVVMGFGVKTDFPTGRSLDLDKSYRILIQPAVKAAGLRCVRADDIIHSGSIDITMYRQLLEADVVVADISTCNPNALYELGVRHALRPYTTITIAEDKIVYPFDVSHIAVRKYQHLGVGIDAEEAERFRSVLTLAIKTLVAQVDTDSPVYSSLSGLQPPVLQALEALEALDAHSTKEPPPPPVDLTLGSLTERAEAALNAGEFEAAKALFFAARELRLDDYLTQRLALVTYKSCSPSEVAALEAAKAILQKLDPEVSNDPETLGLWGAVHKRLWKLTSERAHLDTAILAHERGFNVRTDYYNGINLALLLNMRARVSSLAEQIADFINAERVRRRVIPLCLPLVDTTTLGLEDRYWVCATLAEAYLGIGAQVESDAWLLRANELEVADWMRKTTTAQFAYLRELLEPSPLELLKAPESSVDEKANA